MSGLASVIGQRHRGIGCVFMLHDVVPTPDDLIDSHLQTTVGFLDVVLRYFESRGIGVISIDEAMKRLERRQKDPFVCFTFDDGFRSSLVLALPVFRKYRKPFTVYATTGFLDRRIDYWWGALREAVRRSDEVVLGNESRFKSPDRRSKLRAFENIYRSVRSGQIEVGEITAFCRARNVDPEQAMNMDALNWAELELLSTDPLVEIGAHTDSHRALSTLSAPEARADVTKGKSMLENVIQREVRHFAYPFGGPDACGDREFALCAETGFETGMTTRLGNLAWAHVERRTSLPRNRFNGACERIAFIECQRSGATAAVQAAFENLAMLGAGPSSASSSPTNRERYERR
jgi:peptidoglycan/xylan/chitin deacetylase (PgdA/CDA1 family)